MSEVSSGNGCPFLRALVAQDLLPDECASISDISETVVRVVRAGDPTPVIPAKAVPGIALIANGFRPTDLLRSLLRGVRLDELRGGPLDKKGAGSRILDEHAEVNTAELERMASFGSLKRLPDDRTELGLNAEEIARWMDENFARAQGHRRKIDRRLMEGEWPILLQALGREGVDGRFLAMSDVRELIIDQQLPERIKQRL